jgi:hypothetical protein
LHPDVELGPVALQLLRLYGPLRIKELKRWTFPAQSALELKAALRQLISAGKVATSGRSTATRYGLPAQLAGAPRPSTLDAALLARMRQHALEHRGIRRREVANLCARSRMEASEILKGLVDQRPGLRPTKRQGVYEWAE